MGKIEEKLLADFKKANNNRKESLAKKYGFNSAGEYLKELEISLFGEVPARTEITPEKPVKEKKTKVKPTIHIVNLLDNSGSMKGKKFENAYAGVKEEIDVLKADKSANYIYSLFHFLYSGGYKLAIAGQQINDVTIPNLIAETGTPLYDTIIAIEEYIRKTICDFNIKILVKIFTDGRDMHSRKKNTHAAVAIQAMKDIGVTVTFVGTESDVEDMITDLKIDESNTLVHDNTGEGVKAAFDVSNSATLNYTKNVVAGKDVSKGFYKNIK